MKAGAKRGARRGPELALKSIRISQGRTQTWVASQLGISRQRLCELENNYCRSRINTSELRGLAQIYGTTTDALLKEQDNASKA